MNLNGDTGQISGTPNPASTTEDFTVQVTSTDLQTAAQALQIIVNP